MRPGIRLLIATLTCVIPAASYAGCDESRVEQSRRKQELENYVDSLKQKPRENLHKYEISTVDGKRDYSRLENAISICPVAAKTYGVSNVWYSFTGDLYILPYELTIPEADRISKEICSNNKKSNKLAMYFVDRLSVIKMNSLSDIGRLGDLERSYFRICQD